MSRKRAGAPGSAPPPSDPYAVLGLDRQASESEIKRAYFEGVRQAPPEKDPERFQEIRAAYERLRTPEARARTDLFLLQPPPGTRRRRRRAPACDLAVHAEDVAVIAWARLLARLAAEEKFRAPELLPDPPGETAREAPTEADP